MQAAHECDAFLSIGTSGLVKPAASPPFLALQEGKCVIEINSSLTPLTSQASYVLCDPSGEIHPALA
jgi:NAD-dependent deacetylase